MKNRFSLLTAVVSVLFMALVQSVHQAYASSCFTDTGGHWAETFICWMKTTGLSSGYLDGTFRPNNYITRAEVASLLYKEASGDSYVNIGPNAWQVNSASLPFGYIWYSPTEAILRSSIAGGPSYVISLPVITTLHNQQMTVKGAKLCYDATVTPGGTITDVTVEVVDGTGTVVDSGDDPTTRSDATCRTYFLSSPYVLVGADSLVIVATTHDSAGSDAVGVFGATAIQGFSPTAGVLAPSPSSPGVAP